MFEEAILMLKEQQSKVKECSAPWMVAEQLMDICRRESASAELIAQDLENEKMSIVEAENILREFYGLPRPGEAAPVGISLNLADFLG